MIQALGMLQRATFATDLRGNVSVASTQSVNCYKCSFEVAPLFNALRANANAIIKL